MSEVNELNVEWSELTVEGFEVTSELSEQDLDIVSGGMSLNLGSVSQFAQRDVMMGQQTIAGPDGAGTTNLFGSHDVASAAGQFFNANQ